MKYPVNFLLTLYFCSLDGSKNGDCLTFNTPFSLVTAHGNVSLMIYTT